MPSSRRGRRSTHRVMFELMAGETAGTYGAGNPERERGTIPTNFSLKTPL
jgi:hypothetical protein